MSDICAVVLAAGEGQRLRPLTAHLPKALCPVGNVPLLDRALARVAALGLDCAVNACYLAGQVATHVGERAFVSIEPGDPWGTSGGLARLRDWIDGRHVLVGNADAYLADADRPPGPDIADLLAGWDATTVRLLGVPGGLRWPQGEAPRAGLAGGLRRPQGEAPRAGLAGGSEFGAHRFAGFSLLPWTVVRDLPVERGELVRTAWRPAERAGLLEVVEYRGDYLDTGTPATYLAANLHAAAGANIVHAAAEVTAPVERAVIGAGAVVEGPVTEAVVWAGARVAAGEHLHRAIRAGGGLTVPVGAT